HFTHPFSNFGGSAPVRVGSRGGLGPFGTYDMLGNVKEWCWNQDGAGRRYILGGAWNEPDYMFYWSESNNPFDRSAGNGFRCVKYGAPLPASLTLALPRLNRDYSQVKPVSDEAFRVIRSMYAYERAPLEPKVVSEDSSSEHWRTVKVTYSAGYGNERIPAFLFLPLKATPPFQTVLFFPGAGALNQKSSENLLNMDRLGVLLKSGRAVLHPIYTGTYERRTGLRVGEHNREVVTQWTREISQSVDYLESRPDIDRQRL